MSPLTLRPRAAHLLAQIGPVDQGDVAASLCDVLRMHREDIAAWATEDEDGNPGYSITVDLERTPDATLDWLRQFSGVRPAPAVTDPAEIRRRVSEARGKHRGKVPAIVSEIQTTLTGTRTVRPVKGADCWHMTFVTLAAETPDAAATLARMNARDVKPLGDIFEHVVVDGWTLDEFEAAYPTLAAAEEDFVTLYDLEINEPI